MKKQWKGFMVGFVMAMVLFSCLPAIAAQRQATATYNGAKIMLNGIQLQADPVSINNTTYLPLRSIAEALQLTVDWNEQANTVTITSAGNNVTSTPNTSTNTAGKVLLEQNGIKITYNGITQKEAYLKGYDVNLKIENSNAKNYTVQIRNLSVNGIMADSIFSCDVVAGKTANDSIWLYGLEEKGIKEPITNVEFNFHVYDSETWDTLFDSDTISIGQ